MIIMERLFGSLRKKYYFLQWLPWKDIWEVCVEEQLTGTELGYSAWDRNIFSAPLFDISCQKVRIQHAHVISLGASWKSALWANAPSVYVPVSCSPLHSMACILVTSILQRSHRFWLLWVKTHRGKINSHKRKWSFQTKAMHVGDRTLLHLYS